MEFLASNQVSGQSIQIGYSRLSVLKKLGDVLWENNSKLHDLDLIYASIVKYGFVDPPLWDQNLNGGKGALVYGNGRAEALVAGLLKAEKEGLPIPIGIVTAIDDGEWCVPIGFGVDQDSELKAIALALDHNNSTTAAARSMDSLDVANLWEQEDYLATLKMLCNENELPLTVDEDEYAYLVANLVKEPTEEEPEEEEDASDSEETAEPPCRVELGDVWALGKHRVLCGDSTDAALFISFMALIDGEQADVIWTDPPYGVAYSGTKSGGYAGTDTSIENDELDEDTLLDFLTKAFEVMILAGKPGSPLYCFTPQAELSITFARAMNHSSIKIRQQLIWVKNHFALSRSNYHYKHEALYYAVLPGTREGGVNWQGGHNKTSVFEYDKPSSSRQHPTMKPVELIKDMLQNSTVKGDIVCDTFLGSGSTLLAAQELGLKLFGTELMPRYVSVILDRWEEQTGMIAKKIGSLADMIEDGESLSDVLNELNGYD